MSEHNDDMSTTLTGEQVKAIRSLLAKGGDVAMVTCFRTGEATATLRITHRPYDGGGIESVLDIPCENVVNNYGRSDWHAASAVKVSAQYDNDGATPMLRHVVRAGDYLMVKWVLGNGTTRDVGLTHDECYLKVCRGNKGVIASSLFNDVICPTTSTARMAR